MSEQQTEEKRESPANNPASAPESSFKDLGVQALQLVRNGTELALLELLLALQSVPKAIGVAIAGFFIFLLAWISFSVGVAYWVYTLIPNPLAGIGVFFLLQLSLLGVCAFLLKRYSKRMSLPNTRYFASQAGSVLRESFKSGQ